MISIRVLSKNMAEAESFDDETLVISISSPGTQTACIKGANVFKFAFHDVKEDLMIDSGIINAMTVEMAEAIVEVAVDNRHLKKWVIHCEAGVSRSPGVAIGLASFFKVVPNEEELSREFICHNTHVAKLVKEALRRKMDDIFTEWCYGV